MDSSTSGDETQMPDNYHLKISDNDQTKMSDSDNDQTQMSENDEPPKNQHTSQIFHSRRKRIASDSHLNMDESSQKIGLDPDLGSDSDEDVLFSKPVRKAAKRRQISDVHGQQSYSDSDSHSEYKPENESDSPSDSNSDYGDAADLGAGSDSGSPELGDNLSETQSSYPTQPTVEKSLNKPKASGSKSTEITGSQRAKRVNFKNLKQQSLDEALGRAKQSQQEIDENRKKNKPPSPIKQRKPQKNASWVWDHTEKKKTNETVLAICKLCQRDLGKMCGGSTSNILKHFKMHHKYEYDKGMGKDPDADQPKIDTKLENKRKTWPRDHKKSILCDRQLLRAICKNGLSINIIEDPEFRLLLPKDYQPPNRQTFTNKMLHNGYKLTKAAVQNEISSNPNKFIGLQVDHSTAGNYEQFGSFCVQFVDNDFNLRFMSTGTFPYIGQHTGEAIYESCEGPQGLVDEWDLAKFTRVYTTDSFSGNKKGLSKKGNIYWIPCMAHLLHNIIKNGIEKCQPVRLLHVKMKKILEYCHKSPVILGLLKSNAKWLGLPELGVKTECPTRWNSFFGCLERFLLIERPLNVTLRAANKNDLILTSDDLHLMKHLVTELQSFKYITTVSQSNTTYTFNYYLHWIESIKAQLNRDVNPADTINKVCEFISEMKKHFESFDLELKVRKLAWTACALDPQHKKLTTAVSEDLVNNVVELLTDITPPQSQHEVEPSQPTFHSKFGKNYVKPSKPVMPKGNLLKFMDVRQKWEKSDSESEEEVGPDSLKKIVILEVTNMCTLLKRTKKDLKKSIREGTYDCATWWKENHKQFPNLAKVAKNLFGIPATSANCERAFSHLTNVVTKKRNRLHGETTRRLTFLKQNLQYMPNYSTYSEEYVPPIQPENDSDQDLEDYDLGEWDVSYS